MNDGDSAEEKIGNVGEDGSAARGNEVGGEELVQLGNRVVNANGGGEFVGVRSEHFAEIAGGTGGELRTGVLFAKAKRSVMSQLAAVSACGSAITAARRSGSE